MMSQSYYSGCGTSFGGFIQPCVFHFIGVTSSSDKLLNKNYVIQSLGFLIEAEQMLSAHTHNNHHTDSG